MTRQTVGFIRRVQNRLTYKLTPYTKNYLVGLCRCIERIDRDAYARFIQPTYVRRPPIAENVAGGFRLGYYSRICGYIAFTCPSAYSNIETPHLTYSYDGNHVIWTPDAQQIYDIFLKTRIIAPKVAEDTVPLSSYLPFMTYS